MVIVCLHGTVRQVRRQRWAIIAIWMSAHTGCCQGCHALTVHWIVIRMERGIAVCAAVRKDAAWSGRIILRQLLAIARHCNAA